MRLAAACFALLLPLFSSLPALADGPRLAIVVVGDPAPTTVAAAQRLETALAGSEEASLPADAALRDALRGSAAPELDDGLGPVRALRRGLGWSDEADRETLANLGSRLELVAIVLVRGGEVPEARVYDVAAARSFAGSAPLDEASVETSTRFVLARLRAAEQRRREAPTPGEAAQASETAPSGPGVAADSANPAAVTSAPTSSTPDAPARRSWIARNWPFLVAGALVAGTTTFFIVQRDRGTSSAPVIHIRPGGMP